MICEGLNNFVKEMSERKQEIHDTFGASIGRLVVMLRLRQTSAYMSYSFRATIPIHERGWIDVEAGKNDPQYFEVAKKMNKHSASTRTSTSRRRRNSCVQNIGPMLASRSESSPHWSIRTWQTFCRRVHHKRRFQCCLDPHSADTFLYLRTLQRPFRRKPC